MSMYPLARLLLLSMLLIPLTSQAVTLGEAQVKSFLNQPLEVEIELIGLTPGQHQDLRLRLANQQYFDRLGIVYEHFLNEFSFDVVQSGGRWIVRVRSARPISEPFVDFPLQMTWPGGQMIKQFTLLLDPPRRFQPARVNAAQQATAPRIAQTPQQEAPAAMEAYGPVKSGETLWPIAQRLKPQGITTQQMAMALLRANPQAFIDNNINNLRAATTLSIPSRPFIEQLDAAKARAEFSAQTKSWQAPVATSPRQIPAVSASPQTAAEPAAAQTEEPVTTADPELSEEPAQLRIVSDEPSVQTPDGDEQTIKDQLLVTMEEIETNRITTGAIESRLSRMEDELARMQQLVDLKDAQIAALQAEISAREAIRQAAEQARPAPPATATSPEPVSTTSNEANQVLATPAVTIEATPVSTVREPASVWYEQYLWVVWALLALLGLIAIYLMVRRPQEDTQDAVAADLPIVDHAAAALYQARETPAQDEIRQAEDDFRALRKEPTQPDEVLTETEELPDLELDQIAQATPPVKEGLTNSLLDEMLEDDKHLPPKKTDAEQGISDDDIASWVEELGAEVEGTEPSSANDDQLPDEDDIPSILTELDDQLSSANTTSSADPANIELEPVDEIVEDDTFSMSLDLARAYLEIGDQDGAKDMLKQALSSARDPDHRKQIEELLQQIH